MPLDTLSLSGQVRQMGKLLVRRRAEEQRRLSQVSRLLADYQDRWQELARLAEQTPERVAVPTAPLDQRLPPPPRPAVYTALASDGSAVDLDRHGGFGNYFLLNIGRVRIPYGQPDRE